MADEKETCKHSPCSCAVAVDDYCSAYCEGAGDSVELACNCGHSGCATEL